MVARDDSVIRGSLIACMIFLVLSLALNFFLYRWGSTLSQEATTATDRMSTVSTQVRTMENQLTRLKAMMGIGGFTQAQIDEMKNNSSSDPDMAAIEAQYGQAMTTFGPEVPVEDRSYQRLPDYLINALRDKNEQYATAQLEKTKIRTDAEAEIANAMKSKSLAEEQAAEANKKVATLSTQFDEDRARMNQEKEETRDKLNKVVLDFNGLRRTSADEKTKLNQKVAQLQGTIDTQKNQLNTLRNDQFETTQGYVRFVYDGGRRLLINLGSADALRPGVTFGVIDGEETRLQDADLKASIQIIKIEGPHLAEARVVAVPQVDNPIIPGDKVYSPFWAPGRRVKIAIAGEIDIDGDGRPDNDAIKGQIKAAGAEVAAELTSSGVQTGKLDPTVRFLVVGEAPEISDAAGLDQNDAAAVAIREFGRIKTQAAEYGITIIPAWKLQSYLKTIDDTLTTPLGSAVRGDDFLPPSRVNLDRLPSDISDMYKAQKDRFQEGNRVVGP